MDIEDKIAGLHAHHGSQDRLTRARTAEQKAGEEATERSAKDNEAANRQLCKDFAVWAKRNKYPTKYRTGMPLNRHHGWTIVPGLVVYTDNTIEYIKHAGSKYREAATEAFLRKTPADTIEWAIADIIVAHERSHSS